MIIQKKDRKVILNKEQRFEDGTEKEQQRRKQRNETQKITIKRQGDTEKNQKI